MEQPVLLTDYVSKVDSLDTSARRRFYETLAQNLTVCARGIWWNKQLSDAEKVERLKWLNEIQHRVTGTLRATKPWPDAEFFDGVLLARTQQCPALRNDVGWAVKQSYEYASAAKKLPPRLYIFAGLSGTGKTTLARQLARELHAAYLRIDTIEQAMRNEGIGVDGPQGYVVAYRVAADNLRLGTSVVADSVNPIAITRSAWREVAKQANAPFVEIEVFCSATEEHQRRVESRSADIAGHQLPTWEDVRTRTYERWEKAPLVIDTAGQTESQSFAALWRALEGLEEISEITN